MAVRSKERRESVRIAAAYPITLRDRQGRKLAQGRTVNISEHGVFLLASFSQVEQDNTVLAEITVPAIAASAHRATRTVEYLCRIIRREEIGQLAGLGLEFIQKLG